MLLYNEFKSIFCWVFLFLLTFISLVFFAISSCHFFRATEGFPNCSINLLNPEAPTPFSRLRRSAHSNSKHPSLTLDCCKIFLHSLKKFFNKTSLIEPLVSKTISVSGVGISSKFAVKTPSSNVAFL